MVADEQECFVVWCAGGMGGGRDFRGSRADWLELMSHPARAYVAYERRSFEDCFCPMFSRYEAAAGKFKTASSPTQVQRHMSGASEIPMDRRCDVILRTLPLRGQEKVVTPGIYNSSCEDGAVLAGKENLQKAQLGARQGV